ncbi:MAG: hypothetical protein VXW57_04245, partial [Pseudomonadota bacterium]|nr:hypothetical protein [Pseudomonadota bacterium]
MATGQAQSLGDRLVQPVTNVSDFIWAGLWNGEAVIPFPPLAGPLTGVAALLFGLLGGMAINTATSVVGAWISLLCIRS